MPSEKESFGLAALEAMACEVPVVSSNAGGLPELNVSGETGFVCKTGDIDDMTEKALFILDDNRLPIFKKNALERAKDFDISRIRSEEHTSELQSRENLVCRLLLEKKTHTDGH